MFIQADGQVHFGSIRKGIIIPDFEFFDLDLGGDLSLQSHGDHHALHVAFPEIRFRSLIDPGKDMGILIGLDGDETANFPVQHKAQLPLIVHFYHFTANGLFATACQQYGAHQNG